MQQTIDPEARRAALPVTPHGGGVTLINSFVVPEGRDEEFVAMWTETSHYFRRQPGFVSLRLHRALSPGAPYRYVNVARWERQEDFAAAHGTPAFRQLVSRPEWSAFPSAPVLFEAVVEAGPLPAE